MKFYIIGIIVTFLQLICLVSCFVQLQILQYIGAAITAFGISTYNVLTCHLKECCDDRSIIRNVSGMVTFLIDFTDFDILHYSK